MGKLDKFSGKGLQPSTNRSLGEVRTGLPGWIKDPPAAQSATAEDILRPSHGRFAIALDATGSMAGLIQMAKHSIGEILRRVIAGASRPVAVMIVAYRDYDVPKVIVESSKISSDPKELVAWLDGIVAQGGGGNDGEAVEKALETILEAGRFDAVLLAGDEPPNSRRFLQHAGRAQALLAEDFARRFAQAGTPIHTFVVGRDPRTVEAFASLSALSGGKSGFMDGSEGMIDMAAMAMLAALKGSEGVKDYMRRHRIGSQAASFGQMLLEGPKR